MISQSDMQTLIIGTVATFCIYWIIKWWSFRTEKDLLEDNHYWVGRRRVFSIFRNTLAASWAIVWAIFLLFQPGPDTTDVMPSIPAKKADDFVPPTPEEIEAANKVGLEAAEKAMDERGKKVEAKAKQEYKKFLDDNKPEGDE